GAIFGFYDDVTKAQTSFGAGTFGGIPIQVSAQVTVRVLGLITAGTATLGANVSMGLYTDNNGPATLIAVSNNNTFILGRNEYDAVPATKTGSLTIPAGVYWIMGLFD